MFGFVFNLSPIILEMFGKQWEQIGNILRKFWDILENRLKCRKHIGNIYDSPRMLESSGNILGTFWDILEIFWDKFWICWEHFGEMFGQLFGTCLGGLCMVFGKFWEEF